jgi:outer membrane protein TolC
MIVSRLDKRLAHVVRILFVILQCASCALGQSAPSSSDHAWHGSEEKQIEADARRFGEARVTIEPDKTYSLVELIDFAETHNPETHFGWERARGQAAALGIARSELYPALAAAALSQTRRYEILVGDRFVRQTVQDFDLALSLNYTVFDFGARSARISAARAEVLAANFAFNDTHRKIIYRVEEAYYRLLNSIGQEEAAQASLSNAQKVQQAAEERLANGLATLPDVLEARSATAQSEYDLQAVLGIEEIARGDLATALGISAGTVIDIQTLDQIPTPESVADSVDQAVARALRQRPDLLEQVAQIRSANAAIKEASAAYYPDFTLTVIPAAQSSYGLQQQMTWAHTSGLLGGIVFNLQWTVFDGGLRKNRLVQARANAKAAEAQAEVTRDQIADQVWAAYSNLKTALRERQAATALLEAASQSYDAALESYKYGLRNLLDVTAAQRTLAQARAADVLARTQVLSALANLAFQTGELIQQNAARP